MLSLAIGSIRLGQITSSTPLHCMRGRSAAFGIIFPFASKGSYSGIVFPVESTLVRMSPLRHESMGRLAKAVDWPFRVVAFSYAKKKNALLRPSNNLGI